MATGRVLSLDTGECFIFTEIDRGQETGGIENEERTTEGEKTEGTTGGMKIEGRKTHASKMTG